MSEIKNVVFDFGGVLVDWNPKYLYRKVFDTEAEVDFFLENICNSDWNVLQDAGRSLDVATQILQEKHPEFSDQIAMYYGRWEEMLGGLIESNINILRELNGNYRLYGLTNWSAETLPIARRMYDFFEVFEGIVVSGEEKLVKPDERIYKILLERYGINAAESLYIDDSYDNIVTANRLGFKTVHFAENLNLKEWMRNNNIFY
ncbi:MAG: HAD family hydrolase [Fermentimonas sp.]|jgi:2-haloacid dehalogenase